MHPFVAFHGPLPHVLVLRASHLLVHTRNGIIVVLHCFSGCSSLLEPAKQGLSTYPTSLADVTVRVQFSSRNLSCMLLDIYFPVK